MWRAIIAGEEKEREKKENLIENSGVCAEIVKWVLCAYFLV